MITFNINKKGCYSDILNERFFLQKSYNSLDVSYESFKYSFSPYEKDESLSLRQIKSTDNFFIFNESMFSFYIVFF